MPTKTTNRDNDDDVPKTTKAIISSGTKVLKSNSTSTSASDGLDKTLQNNVKKMPTSLIIITIILALIGVIALVWFSLWLIKHRKNKKKEAEQAAKGGTVSGAV